MTTNLINQETVKLTRRAAEFLGGPGQLARYLRVGRPHVMRLIQGRTIPNTVAMTALRAIVAEFTAPEAYDLREKGSNHEHRNN